MFINVTLWIVLFPVLLKWWNLLLHSRWKDQHFFLTLTILGCSTDFWMQNPGIWSFYHKKSRVYPFCIFFHVLSPSEVPCFAWFKSFKSHAPAAPAYGLQDLHRRLDAALQAKDTALQRQEEMNKRGPGAVVIQKYVSPCIAISYYTYRYRERDRLVGFYIYIFYNIYISVCSIEYP